MIVEIEVKSKKVLNHKKIPSEGSFIDDFNPEREGLVSKSAGFQRKISVNKSHREFWL